MDQTQTTPKVPGNYYPLSRFAVGDRLKLFGGSYDGVTILNITDWCGFLHIRTKYHKTGRIKTYMFYPTENFLYLPAPTADNNTAAAQPLTTKD